MTEFLVLMLPIRAPDRSGFRLVMLDKREMLVKLSELRVAHRDLDEVIQDAAADQLLIQRLKKRKLKLKDEILKLESELLPDIIA